MKNKTKINSLFLVIAIWLFFGALHAGAASIAAPTNPGLAPVKLEPVKIAPKATPMIAPKKKLKTQPLSIERKRSVLFQVPNLAGRDISQARAVLKKKKIDLKIKSSEESYHPTIAAGHIISQDPLPGTLASAKTVIKIVISKGGAPMPGLRGKLVEAAVKILTGKSCQYKPYDLTLHQTGVFSDLRAGSVVRQIPGTGTPLKKGARIALYVSKGPAPRIACTLSKTESRHNILPAPAVSALKSRMFTLNNTRVVQGNPAEIRFQGHQNNWKRAAFYIGRHKISPLTSARNGTIRIPTGDLPPGRYKVLVCLPHAQENLGEIRILPGQVFKKTARLSRAARFLGTAMPMIPLEIRSRMKRVTASSASAVLIPWLSANNRMICRTLRLPSHRSYISLPKGSRPKVFRILPETPNQRRQDAGRSNSTVTSRPPLSRSRTPTTGRRIGAAAMASSR